MQFRSWFASCVVILDICGERRSRVEEGRDGGRLPVAMGARLWRWMLAESTKAVVYSPFSSRVVGSTPASLQAARRLRPVERPEAVDKVRGCCPPLLFAFLGLFGRLFQGVIERHGLGTYRGARTQNCHEHHIKTVIFYYIYLLNFSQNPRKCRILERVH